MVFPSCPSLSVLSKLTPLRTHAGEAFSCVNSGHQGRAMANVAVIGAQWGDEGKGKIVDWLSERAEVVVRFQGGHNAGHTLVIGNQTYRLALLAVGRRARGQAFHHRQRRRGRSLALPRGGEEGVGPGRVGDARQPQDRQPRRADPAAAPRPRRLARGRAGHDQDRHDAARHRPGLRGQGRPPRHPGRRPGGARLSRSRR